jgi:DNA-binding NarL/FixJ family response regulator
MLNETYADIVVVDLASARESDLAHDWLSELLDSVSVVVLTSAPDPRLFNFLLRAERGALLRSDAPAEQIVRAIQSTSVGLLTVDTFVVPQPETAEEDLLEELTPREIEVLRLLAEGFANREIAHRLNISEHTIKFHIRSILAKLQASTRTEAVTRGFRSGLIEL